MKLSIINKKVLLFLFSIYLFQLPLLCMAHTTVYQWTDKSGNTVFSDKPRKGARKLEVPNVSTIDIPDVPPYIYPLPSGKKSEQQYKANQSEYQNLKLVEPIPESTIWSNQGNFLVYYEAEPELQTNLNHRLIVSLDGKERPPIHGNRYYFENIDRGAHQLQARIINDKNDTLIESDLVAIYLQQHSVNYPTRK